MRPAATPARNRGRKTLDVENHRANGHGYLGDIVRGPDHGLPDDVLEAGDRPTIPVAQWTSSDDKAADDYPGSSRAASNGGQAANDGASADAFSPESGLSAQAPESFALPQAAPLSRGPGKWLRGLIGVDELLLARVWEERARYTCLGAIVLGTATMAALSMLDALDQILGPVWPVLVLVALFWGAFICGIDRWLIASTHGARSGRWRIFVPRIFLAMLFGVIIATPLVLTVFGSEVVSQAQNDQSNALLTYESQLKLCNPLPDQPAKATAAAQSAGCAQFYVQVSNPAIGTDKAIAAEEAQENQLNAVIAADNSQIASLNTVARDECNGVSGSGLSGVVGVGPNCDRDRQKADSFASTSDVAKLQAEVTSLNNKMATQTVTAGQQTQTYAANISNAIADLVTTKKQQEGRIGLLNRIDALGELAATHVVIAAATVLLALFIIAVDCLPVLSKMMSGTTRYDSILEHRLRIAERMAAESMKVTERRATGEDEMELYRIESRVRAELERIDEESRFDRAKRDAALDRQIARIAAEYRRSADMEGNIAS
jgi:Domain of unknown function (DUF4407)